MAEAIFLFDWRLTVVGLGRRWTFFVVNGFPDFHHEYLWQWVIRVGDCTASSPLGLSGVLFMDFGTAWSWMLQAPVYNC